MMLPGFSRSVAWSARNPKWKPTATRILAFERLEQRSLLAAIPTLTTLATSASTVAIGQSLTLTATVIVAPPNTGTPNSGLVTFLDGTTVLGSVALNNAGQAVLETSALPMGLQVLAASYAGDGLNFAPSSTQVGPSSIITTVAGNGTTFNGDNGPATAADLGDPGDVAVDSAGDLFIVDAANNRIREVNQATGVITTVAGDGTAGYSGDGGLATAAELDSPTGVAVDSAGDLFIADSGNERIREVNHATRIITTIAGNGLQGYSGDNVLATAAELWAPTAVAVDPAGDIFIADVGHNRIREVNHATSVITTVAGNGTSGYSGDNGPATTAELAMVSGGGCGIAVDSAGNLFIADAGNNRIREVNLSTGVITTVAGNGSYGYSGDGGPATAAEMWLPDGVAVDSAGNLFIADNDSNRVREVNLGTGLITTVAGNGTRSDSGDNGPATAAALVQPWDVAVDSAGDLFIAEYYSDRVREVNLGDGVITTVAGGGSPGDGGEATAAQLSWPASVAMDSAGNLFISDSENDRIREVNHATGIITTVAGNGLSGDSGDNGPATAAELDNPEGIAVDSAGDLFIADSVNNVVREVNHATGVITTVAGSGSAGYSGENGPATAAQLWAPYGVAVDSTGNLFIAEYFDNVICEVNHATGVITTVAGNGIQGYSGDNGPATAAELDVPIGIAVDATGDLFIADSENGRIREVNHVTGVITTVAGTTGLGDPLGVAVDSAGDLFIAETGGGRVCEVNLSTGVITTTAGGGNQCLGDDGPASASQLWFPSSVVVDSTGDLFIADAGDNRIREVATGVTVTVVAVPTLTGVSPDSGSATGGTSVTITGSGFTGATAVNFGTVAATSFVVDSDTQITATSPAGMAGTVDVTVTTVGGTSATSTADQFTYVSATVSLDWSGPGTPLNLTEGTPGATPTVTISEPSPDTSLLKIDLGAGEAFASGSTTSATGLTYQNPGSPTTSQWATIDISDADNISSLVATLPGDDLTLGQISDSNTGIGGIDATAATIEVAGIDTSAANGDVDLTASGNLTVDAGATVETGTGTITLAADVNADGTGNDGLGTLSIDAGATVTSTNATASAITLRGANVDIATAANPAVVGASRQLSSTPSVTLTGLNDPYALAFDSHGNLYVANFGNNTVSEFAPGGTTPIATLTGLDGPLALAFDSRGNLFVANTGSPNGGAAGTTVSEFAPGSTTPTATLTGLDAPLAMAFDGNGDLYVANLGDPDDGAAGTTVSEFAPGSTTPTATLIGVSGPYALAFDSSGNLFVANFGNHGFGTTVSEFAPGSTTPTATLNGVSGPNSLVFDPSGNLYVANVDHTVSKFAPGGITPNATLTAALTSLTQVEALAIDGSGNLYVANFGNGSGTTVSKFAPGSITPTETLAGVSGPDALAVDSSGNLYVANYGGTTVNEFAAGSTATPTAGGVVIRSSLPSRPMSLGGTQSAVAGINLTAAELAQIYTTTAGTITIGDSSQTGNITFTTATPATTAGASINVVQDPAGPGQIILDDGAGSGTGLSDNSGRVTLTSGTGGIVAPLSATGAPLATNGFTATGLTLIPTLNFAPVPGTQLTVINNTATPASSNPIVGTFANLPQGGTISVSYNGTPYLFQANYSGGDGNDLVLTAVAAPTVTVADPGGTYNGLPFPATAQVNGAASLGGVAPTVTYYAGSLAAGQIAAATPLSAVPTAAGMYTVVASFAGNTDYTVASSAPAWFTIAKATPMVTANDAGGPFNGSPYTVTALVAGVVSGVDTTPAASLEGVTPTVAYYAGSLTASQIASATPLSGAPSAAGTYTVVASFAGSADYAAASSGTAVTYNPAADFEKGWTANSNSNGVWSYGYSLGFTSPITLYNSTVQNGVNGPQAQYWLSSAVDNGTSPAVEFNDGPAYDDGNVDFLANQLVLVAGIGGQYSDLVFTAPASGTYSVTGSFRGDQYGIGTAVGVTANGEVVFNSSVIAEGQTVPFNTDVSLTAGDTVVFSAGPDGGLQNTGLTVTVTPMAGGTPTYFTISKATPTVTVADAGGIYNGSPFPATAQVNGSTSLEGVAPTMAYYTGSLTAGQIASALPLPGAPSTVGAYTVDANFAGSTNYSAASSPPAYFTVRAADYVTTQPVSQTVDDGQIASFTAASSNPGGADTVQWKVSTNGGATFNTIAGATSTTYSFTASLDSHGAGAAKDFRTAGPVFPRMLQK